jgi:hypothetical protein
MPTFQPQPPAPGQPWQGGIYAGVSAADADQPAGHIILLPNRPDSPLNWQQAVDWAQSLGDGARLPTRFEAALLYANLCDQLDCTTWHWTGTQHSHFSSAWHCCFGYGYQYYNHESYEGGAVAVRRLILESFNPSV